jgi:hypothetical protein
MPACGVRSCRRRAASGRRAASVLALLALTASCALGQEAPKPPEASAAPDFARRPCIAAYGLSNAADVPEFRKTGFDCAVIELPLDFAEADADRERLEQFLTACDAEDVAVIMGVEVEDVARGASSAFSPYDQSRMNRIGAQVYDLTSLVGDHPCVIAWMAPRRLSESLTSRPDDFAGYLQRRYGSVDKLNEWWDTGYRGFGEATPLAVASRADAAPLGLNLALVDLADFQTRLHRDALAFYVDAYGRYDALQRPVLAGEECNYWALANLPPGMAGGITGLRPDEAGPDPVLGNPIAVDVLRAGGLHVALHGIEVRRATNPLALRGQMAAAFLHGAYGVVLSDWQTVAGEKELRDVLPEARAWTEQTGPLGPHSAIALLYQPMHAGAQSATGRHLGGLLATEGWPSEPLSVLELFARGSRFGGIDVIPAHEASPAVLARYATVLAPQAYDVDRDLAASLWQFVKGGGLLYGDLGMGLRQSGAMTALPPELIGLAGLLNIPYVLPMQLGGTVDVTSPFLPSLSQGDQTAGTVFGPIVGDARLTAGASPLVVFRARRVAQRGNALYYSGISINPLERGAMLFATAPALSGLSPEDPLGALFWIDLTRRGARVESLSGDGLFPRDLEVRAGRSVVAVASYGAPVAWAQVVRGGVGGTVFEGALTQTGEASADSVLLRIPAEAGLGVAQAMPARVVTGATCVWVYEFSEQRVRMLLAPVDADWTFADREPSAVGGTPTRMALELGAGRLPILPNEQFDVTMRQPGNSGAQTLEAMAGADGILRLDVGETGPVELTVTPRNPRPLPGQEKEASAR